MASQARFILSKIARNEAEGKADPRDAARVMASIMFCNFISNILLLAKSVPEINLIIC